MIYITLQEIIDDHAIIIHRYGGVHGIRDIGLLASALEMPKANLFDEDLHPTVFDKAAAYLYHIVSNHPFVDGNKRTGTIAALTFLRQNQVYISFTDQQSLALEQIVVLTASGTNTKSQLAQFFKECTSKKPKASIKI